MRHPNPLLILAVVAALGCPANEPGDQPALDTRSTAGASSAGASTSRASPAPAPWYSAARTLDLTGDGRADSVRLVATGSDTDSLSVTLTFTVDGEEKLRERWSSVDELILLDSAARVMPRAEPVLRAQLDSVLASVVVQRFDAPGVVIMAEDSAALAGLDPRPTQRVSFSYGYETTVRLVWDAPRRRFVRLFSCC